MINNQQEDVLMHNFFSHIQAANLLLLSLIIFTLCMRIFNKFEMCYCFS